MKITIPYHLSDDDLVAAVKSLARREQDATARLVPHLAELDGRRLNLAAGFSSLFTYCCEVLRLSEAEAYNRIEVARTLAPDRYEIPFTARAKTCARLAQDLLRHALPTGDVAELFYGRELVLERGRQRRQKTATGRDETAGAPPG